MKWTAQRQGATGAPASAGGAEPEVPDEAEPTTLEAQRERLIRVMKGYFGMTPERIAAIQAVFKGSKILGQGNPLETRHPMTRKECAEIRKGAGLGPRNEPVCGEKNMVPLGASADAADLANASACIDQYEFPNIPCEFPIVHVTAQEAAQLCGAVGKRLCDAHEWEGGCAGALRDPKEEYAWGRSRSDMKSIHNNNRKEVWAYGATKNHELCATGSVKNKECHGGGYKKCGSNTYPAGAFPKCVSAFGVFDQHGNAAEHMNLPMAPDELASLGKYGETEMKGSWFIFKSYEAHIDDCNWRAPDWHATKVMSPNSHSNYHLGFRCCKNVGSKVEAKGAAPDGAR